MKKLVSGILFLCLFLGVTGCSGSNAAEDIAKKIEDTKWELEFDKDEGTVVASITLQIDETEEIKISIDKENDKVTSVDYYSRIGANHYCVSYYCEEKINVGSIMSGDESLLIGYNIDEDKYMNELAEEMNSEQTDISSSKDKTKKLLKTRDKSLEKVDLTLEELETWGNWYYQEHK